MRYRNLAPEHLIYLIGNAMKELQSLMDDISTWSNATFGKYDRTKSITHHLKKEVDELLQVLEEVYSVVRDESIGVVETNKKIQKAKMEYADCFMLLLDSAYHFGLTAETIFEVTRQKLEVNKHRHWGKPDKNGVVEHLEFVKCGCYKCDTTANKEEGQQNMSKEEAVLSMAMGDKVTHRFFEKGEWMSMKDGMIILDDGATCTPYEFWEKRKGFGWSDGYSIYKEKN